jgi:hypothetical protein
MALAYCKEFGSRIPDRISAGHVLAFVIANASKAAYEPEDFVAIEATRACAERVLNDD